MYKASALIDFVSEFPSRITSYFTKLINNKNSSGSENSLKYWFSDLLNKIDQSTTQYIEQKVPNAKFTVVEQSIHELYVLRKIVFRVGDYTICEAINKLMRNNLVDEWIQKNPSEPFGRFFQNKNLHRTPIQITDNSRKYFIKGDIVAEVEEKFHPLPKS